MIKKSLKVYDLKVSKSLIKSVLNVCVKSIKSVKKLLFKKSVKS